MLLPFNVIPVDEQENNQSGNKRVSTKQSSKILPRKSTSISQKIKENSEDSSNSESESDSSVPGVYVIPQRRKKHDTQEIPCDRTVQSD